MDWGRFQDFKKVVAIDPGSYECGIAWFTWGRLQGTKTIYSDDKDIYQRRFIICERLRQVLDQADVIICEEPFLRGPPNNTMQRLLGAFEYLARGHINFISPMTVKAFTGSGKNDKLQVAKGAREFLAEQERCMIDDLISRNFWNETDAIAVGLAWINRELQKENKRGRKKRKSN